jgi:hypothetical protein
VWLYNGQEVTDIEEKYVAFVYLITNLTNNRRYIGKKLTKFSRTKTVKGKKKKVKIDSDWQTYWSSSEEVKKDVVELGEHNFRREILHFCISKGTSTYLEAKEQFSNEVLEHPELWYNGHIQCRVHRNHLKFEK